MLATCRESREIALRKYKPFFDPKWWCPPGPEPIVYVNNEIDTFYFDSISHRDAKWNDEQLFDTFRTELDDLGGYEKGLAPIKHLCFDANNFLDEFLLGPVENLVSLSMFRDLETVTLAIPTHSVNATSPLIFLDLVDSALEKEDPTSLDRFRTIAPIASEIDCYLKCSPGR